MTNLHILLGLLLAFLLGIVVMMFMIMLKHRRRAQIYKQLQSRPVNNFPVSNNRLQAGYLNVRRE